MTGKSVCSRVLGVGINDADYAVTRHRWTSKGSRVVWLCPFYRTWRGMLERCSSEQWQQRFPTYVGCTVCDEWLTFSKFKVWMEQQDWEGKDLDKDFLSRDEKTYSPSTCAFISRDLNAFMNNHAAKRGVYPTGVNWHKASNKWVARCGNPFTGKRESLGYFSDPDVAHQAWRRRKHELACQYADTQTDPRVAEALRSKYAI